MIDTIMFDLDGTLLKISQEVFTRAYFAQLEKAFVRMGLNAELSLKALWAGTKAMMLNDGSTLNANRFWGTFAKYMNLTDEKLSAIEAGCDYFYMNEFHSLKSVVEPSDIPKRLVRAMVAKGYTVALATNPLFPACAVAARIGWIELNPNDFHLITHYSNSTFCKPNPGYYREIFTKLGKTPQQCLMAGNNPAEDMCAGALGTGTFLVTDYLENDAGLDVSSFQSGTLVLLEEYLMALPDLIKT